ncbi:insulinase [Clostridium sporogenes]|uniref:M16 family metallopeptidase n=1 Tax=Clostridium botulinum TaxID=1491 RepID=UPI000717B6EA|nr:pitrilysin family protein [Clostridium botulinum]KRU24767.1 insulinase [Clostridium sporogenes]KRU28495.1 insulinase [Clostridium sporogenes]KRU29817.1 insulinase [Clostridium sporogenes]KRU37724.1 insulinase [Clostridium sporogenes]MBZ1330607.1 insulinase family protein [Clostridium botulinum]
MYDAKKTILKNGITLVTIKKDTQIAAIHAGIKIGSIYESEKEKGISHFIEHMLFKGTKYRDNETLNRELENLGGEYNAYTDSNSTVCSITVLEEELEKSIEILGDMFQNCLFPQEEIEREREVILSEIRGSKDDLEDYSFKKVNETAFDKSPLKYDTLGNEKIVKSFTRDKFIKFYERYYVPNNCFISIVSDFPHNYVVSIVEKYFKDWLWKEFKREKVLKEKNRFLKKVSYKNNVEQSTVVYLFTLHGLSKKEELALTILSHRLGESGNSVLFRELREKRGFAYDVYTDLDLSPYVKTLYIYTSVGRENVDETLDVINNCIESIKKGSIGFDSNTINLMKKILKTAIAFTLEDVTDIGNYAFHQIIDEENIFQFYEDMKDLDGIKEEDIYNVANKVLNKPTIHILLNQ